MTNDPFDANVTVIVMAIVTAIVLGLWISMFIRMSMLKCLLLAVAVNAVTAAWLLVHGVDRRIFTNTPFFPQPGQPDNDATQLIQLLAIYATANFGVALLVKLYRAAVLGQATPDESQGGLIGARAWLVPINIILVAAFTIAAYAGFNYSPFATAFLSLIGLLAYPLINSLQTQTVLKSAPPQAPAEERERVLALVETGKITAEEGAELLGALAQSHVAETDKSISNPRRIMMAGAAIVLIGFLLPWFTLDVPGAAQAMMNTTQQMLPQIPNGPIQNNVAPVPAHTVTEYTINGGDIAHGLGWVALATALLVAGLPFFQNTATTQPLQQRNFTLGILTAGSVAVLYLISTCFNSYTSIDAGFILAIGGYAVIWLGCVREYFVHHSAMTVQAVVV